MGIVSGTDRTKRIRRRMQKQEMQSCMQRGIPFQEAAHKMHKEKGPIHVERLRRVYQGMVKIYLGCLCI